MMVEPPRKIPVVFYRTAAGAEVVRDWLRGLDRDDRDAIGQDLMRVQFRWPVGMPLCRSLGQGLWGKAFGRCAATCRANALRGCCSALLASGSSRCMASSR